MQDVATEAAFGCRGVGLALISREIQVMLGLSDLSRPEQAEDAGDSRKSRF